MQSVELSRNNMYEKIDNSSSLTDEKVVKAYQELDVKIVEEMLEQNPIKNNIRKNMYGMLKNIECTNCPLEKSCRLNLNIHEKSICDELRENKIDESTTIIR